MRNTRNRCISSNSKWFRWPNINIAGKRLASSNKQNEAETDETGLEAEGKGNGGKSALFNLKDLAILHDLLNLLSLLQMMSLETSIELNIDSVNLRFSFPTRCNLCE